VTSVKDLRGNFTGKKAMLEEIKEAF